MLLDPFEKQFDLPAELVQTSNCLGREAEVVGQKEESLVYFGVDVMDTSQQFGIVNRTFRARQSDGLVAAQTPVLFDLTGCPT